jgi:flagellar assembly factor FliW
MKVLPETAAAEADNLGANAITLPNGIIGFADYKRAELLYSPEHLPFLWMQLQGPSGVVNFVVVEPAGLIPGYELEIFDNDAEALDITDPADAMVLNIVTLRPDAALQATANLIGPIVINRRTRIGRQLVIANYAKYSARCVLLQQEASTVLASA